MYFRIRFEISYWLAVFLFKNIGNLKYIYFLWFPGWVMLIVNSKSWLLGIIISSSVFSIKNKFLLSFSILLAISYMDSLPTW